MKKGFIIILSIIVLAAYVSGCGSSGDDESTSDETSGDILYVDASATGTNSGSSWTNAYTSLATALVQAVSGKQIWVAEGTYYPTTGTDRTATFTLVAGVSVYGGFSGTETSLDERDTSANPTILSGDIDGNGILDEQNSYHVVTGVDDAILDGFTIEMGYAVVSGTPPSDFDSYDGIITVESGHEDDEILRIVRGVKYIAGAGMLNLQAAPTVQNCIFQDNYASKGGAVYNMIQRDYPDASDYDSPVFENCIFNNNYATTRGGAVNNDMYTDPAFISCRFLENECESKGGAVYSDMGCNATLVNVLFADNIAERGTALVSDGSSIPSLLYVTMVNNYANDIGASLYQGTYGADGQTGGEASHSNDPKIMYSLVMGNTSEASGTSISNWLDDSLNIDDDSIVETTDGDYTLTDYFEDPANGDYEPTAPYASLGWSATRDTTDWETAVAALSTRIYSDFPYDTSNSAGSGATYYVDAAATGSDNGSSWANAYTDLQDALDAAEGGEAINVAAGTYYPTSSTTDREASFVLKQGVAVYGGYPSGGGARDISLNTTTLSGDIDKDGWDGDDSYHVVVGGKGSTLDGFTVAYGYADGQWFHQRGGGMLIYGSTSEANDPSISDCTFSNNYAVEGAAIACYNYGIPTISDCDFDSNTASRGGALLLRTGSDAIVTGSSFNENDSLDRGGAVFIDYGSSPEFTSCTFDENTSDGYGGAVYVDDNASQIVDTSPVFTSCTFTDNSTIGAYGGAVFAYNTVTYLTLNSCVFGTNTSDTAGGNIGLRFLVSVNFSDGDYANVYDDGTVTYNY